VRLGRQPWVLWKVMAADPETGISSATLDVCRSVEYVNESDKVARLGVMTLGVPRAELTRHPTA